MAQIGEVTQCVVCRCHYIKKNNKQGLRCRTCINKKQRQDISKRQAEPVSDLSKRLLSRLWTPEALA